MKKILLLVCLIFAGCDSTNSDIDKILRAKNIVRGMTNYPDTLSFHEFSTQVNGNTVHLKFTCKNGFGVPETHVMDVDVR